MTKVARRPKTRQITKSDNFDEADEEDSQSDPEECYNSSRNLRVETLGSDHRSAIVENSPGRIAPEPPKLLTTIGQDLSDVTFPENGNLPDLEEGNLPDLEEGNLPDLEEGNLPDPEEGNLPDPEEGTLPSPEEVTLPGPAKDNLTDGPRSEEIPERELNSVHCPMQTTPERNGNRVVIDETESENNCLRRSTREKKATRQLTYPELGNPLVTVVQSLFQSLSEAVTDSLTRFNYAEPCSIKIV